VLGLLFNLKVSSVIGFGMYISFQYEVLADLLCVCVCVYIYTQYFSLFKLAVLLQIYGENVFLLSAAGDVSVGSCSQSYPLS